MDDSAEWSKEDILELEDEDGNALTLALLAMVEVEGNSYAMCAPLAEVQSDDDNSAINLMLLAYSEDEEGGVFDDIDDPVVYQKVMAVCMELIEQA